MCNFIMEDVMGKEQTQDNVFQSNRFQSNTFQGDMEELKGKVRQLWGKLSDDEIEHCEDQRDRLLKAVEQQYGIPREKADKTLRDIERQCGKAA
jgi:uncharacterized protein YjbJ (UPF0337 family)